MRAGRQLLVVAFISVMAVGVGQSYVLQHAPSGFKVVVFEPHEVAWSYDANGLMAYAKTWDLGHVAQYTVSQPFYIRPDCGGNAVEEIDVVINVVHTSQGNDPLAAGCSTLNTVTPWVYIFNACGIQNSTYTLRLKTNTAYRLETNARVTGGGTADTIAYRSEIRLTLPSEADSSPPSIDIDAPAGTYFLNQVVAADYTCTDCGSGIDQCVGSVAAGTPIDTSTVGTYMFNVTATDNAGHSATASSQYTVGYQVKSLHDKQKCHNEGSTIPIKVQLADAAGANVSAEDVALTALEVRRVSDVPPDAEDAEDSGNANPDGVFRFTTFNGAPGYMFNLKTTGLASGVYVLTFKAGSDDTVYETEFCIR